MSHMELKSVRAAYIHKAEHLDEHKLGCCSGGLIFWMRTGKGRWVRLTLQKKVMII